LLNVQFVNLNQLLFMLIVLRKICHCKFDNLYKELKKEISFNAIA